MYIKIVKNLDLKFHSIKKNLYDIRDNREVISKFVPIKYHDMYYLIAPLNSLEGLFLEKNNHIIEVFIIYNNEKKKLKLKNRVCIYNEDYNNDILYDCYFDIYQNLLLINVCKQKLNNLDFINLEDYDILEYFSFDYNNLNLKVNTNKLNIFEKINIENKYYWDDKFILLPEVPYIKFQTENGLILSGSEIIGSKIENSSVERLFGITYKCEFDEDTKKYEYLVIPIFGILKSLKIILGQKYLLLGIDLQVQVINSINDDKVFYCLVNDETFYNIYETKDYAGNNIKITTKIFDKNTIIYKIDNYKIDKNGHLDMNGKKIPIKSYIWYFKELDNDNYYNLKYHKLKINTLGSKFIEIKTKIYNNKNFSINLSDFNYINYKNKLVFELNESILYLIRDYLFENDTYRFLIDFIIKNKYKNNKIILGIEIVSDTINYINNLLKEENNNNNFEIKIINNSIQIQPKIFLIKKYNSIQEILNNFKEKKKLLVLIESLFNLHQKINKKIFS